LTSEVEEQTPKEPTEEEIEEKKKELLAEVEELKKQKLLNQLVHDNKMTPDFVEKWGMNQSLETLTQFEESAPILKTEIPVNVMEPETNIENVKPEDKPEEHEDESFWSSVEEIAKNIIKVVKDTIRLIKGEK